MTQTQTRNFLTKEMLLSNLTLSKKTENIKLVKQCLEKYKLKMNSIFDIMVEKFFLKKKKQYLKFNLGFQGRKSEK